MGLCKCERRKVTNLFCFEHRVNVCDHCAIADHKRCVIKSYLHWLQDSDYSPNCELCKQSLQDDSTGECVRLLCYDVFHWHCLNKWASSMPANTAPAGFACPACNSSLFPPANDMSPVAVALRQLFSTVSWSRAGLGLPILASSEDVGNMNDFKVDTSHISAPLAEEVSHSPNPSPLPIAHAADHQHGHISPPHVHADFQMHIASATGPMSEAQSVNDERSKRSLQFGDGVRNTTTNSGMTHMQPEESAYVRKQFSTDMRQDDESTNKYKRKSPLLLLARWLSFGAAAAITPRELTLRRRRRTYMLLLLFGVIILTLIYFGISFGRSVADSDPLLDPRANPHIRIKPDGGETIEKKPAIEMEAVLN